MKRYFLHGIILFFLLACGKDSKPEQQEYITIGGLFPLTGELCNEGIRALNGLQLARNVLNKKGGILGKQLDIIVLDDKNDVQYAIEQYKALKEKGVIAIIGSSFPEVTQALAEAAEKDSMPIISPMIVNPAKAKALASFAYNTLNARTALILDNSKYTSTTNIFEEEFKLKG
ncbi:MAG: ABC transporter substrate-binding protein, partial [Fibromonadales bacterium]|nr:ABC transporter substrate-binding protein [Fibromonadales bacterium]